MLDNKFDNMIRFMFWTNDRVSAFRRAMVILPLLFFTTILIARINDTFIIPLFLFIIYSSITFVYVMFILTDSGEKLLKYYIFRPFDFSNSILDFKFYSKPIKKDKKEIYSIEFELLYIISTSCVLINDEKLWKILKSIKVTDNFYSQYRNYTYGDIGDYNLPVERITDILMTSDKILYSKLKLISK